MNTLQKILVSSTAILSFSFYSYVLRAQDAQITAVAPATSFTDTQTPPVAVQNNPAPSVITPSAVRRGEEDSWEGEDDGEDGGRRIVAAAPVLQTPSQTQTQPVRQLVPAPAPQQTPVAPPPSKPKGQYFDGTYTGASVDVYYGYVQVKAIIQNGRIADVVFLQYPSDRSTSRYINSQAMPLLKQEAIQAQSANVSGVSGASATSEGFVQSLADALSQARA